MGAVDHLLEGDAGPGNSMMDDAVALGIECPEVAAPPFYDVWPENAPAVELFLAIQTQWRSSASGGVLGLDYGVAFSVMDLKGIKRGDRLDTLAGLQIMEGRAIEIINSKGRD